LPNQSGRDDRFLQLSAPSPASLTHVSPPPPPFRGKLTTMFFALHRRYSFLYFLYDPLLSCWILFACDVILPPIACFFSFSFFFSSTTNYGLYPTEGHFFFIPLLFQPYFFFSLTAVSFLLLSSVKIIPFQCLQLAQNTTWQSGLPLHRFSTLIASLSSPLFFSPLPLKKRFASCDVRSHGVSRAAIFLFVFLLFPSLPDFSFSLDHSTHGGSFASPLL